MKKSSRILSLIVGVLGLANAGLQAQEVIPREELLKATYMLWQAADKLDGLALKVDVDIKNPYGLAKDNMGLVVIPETKLADVLAKASETALPLGQLWLRGLVLEVEGKSVPDSKLKLVEVSGKNETVSVALCTLGVKKTEKSGLELVIYGKGKEVLKTVAFKAVKSGKQEYPIEFSVIPGNDNAEVTIKVLGQQEATITVRKQD